MADLKAIKKRIGSVQNTRQITRAMKMVAAAKLRRAQEGILSSRPYAYRIYSILLGLFQQQGVSHPLLVARPEKKIRLVVLAGDRGLCGSFNATIFKEAQRFLKTKKEENVEVTLDVIGKKAFEFFKKRHPIQTHHEGLLGKATYPRVSAIANELLEAYKREEFDAIYIIYNEFKSAISQKVTVERLIPISEEVPEGVAGIWTQAEVAGMQDYIFEPEKQKLLDEIVPRHFRMQFFRCVLESIASEHGARMSAMENATQNASEMIGSLTLEYNKARQEKITKELTEIVGGVEAMK
ncbi:MAG: ATP synthase F1 subunit gamma [Proteobacteria bacterium]|nr:ATP synthase F1 subunit gamma [Pseudomonadota bacterium]